MQIHRSEMGMVVQAPAKLNLFFEVLGKRADGYHEIETLMCPVDLYDTIWFREEPGGRIRLSYGEVSGFWRPNRTWLSEVPDGPANLIVRAVELLQRRAGVPSGAELRLVKRIPTAAGLGGGSSDAAAALVAANAGWRLDWSMSQLSELAGELGSDVPFFLANRPAICRGRGEQVEPLTGLGELHFVIVRPPQGLSTRDVYQACRPAAQPRRLAPLLGAFASGDGKRMGGLLFNRLQPAAESLSPWIDRLRRKFTEMDCLGHGMSGSGTSYFGLCRHARHALRVARRLLSCGVGSVFAVRSCR
jgi:4-diphosphocytidyl-2-C-methyl-D-erythritol kinase